MEVKTGMEFCLKLVEVRQAIPKNIGFDELEAIGEHS